MTAFATVVLGLGVVIALVQLREAERDRHLQWIFEVNRVYNSHQIRKSLRALLEIGGSIKLRETIHEWLNDDDPVLGRRVQTLLDLPNFLESVALTSQFGGVDPELVWQSLSGPAETTWDLWEPAVKLLQEEFDPEAFSELKNFVQQLDEYGKKRKTLGQATLETRSLRATALNRRLVSYAALLIVLTIVQIVALTTR